MNQKTRKIIITTVVLLVIAFIIYFVIRPTNEEITTENNPTQEYNNNYDTDFIPGENQAINSSSSNSNSNVNSSTGTGHQSSLIKIEKINIQAPISINVDGNDMEKYLKALETGVAHMSKTAFPGEVGNSVIFGHSSYYRLKPGSYKTVFAPLDRLSDQDLILITYNNTTYRYKVSEIKKVQPEETSVVEQNDHEHKLTLITCWPPTTTNQRLVVVADLVE